MLARRDQLMFVLGTFATKGNAETDEEGLLLLRRQAVEQECDRLFSGVSGCLQRCLLLCAYSLVTVSCSLLPAFWVPVGAAFSTCWHKKITMSPPALCSFLPSLRLCPCRRAPGSPPPWWWRKSPL